MKIVFQNLIVLLTFIAYNYFCLAKNNIKVGAFFNEELPTDDYVNWNVISDHIRPGTEFQEPEIKNVPDGDSFETMKTFCEAIAGNNGYSAIFGPKNPINSETIESICSFLQIPYILTKWTPTAATEYPNTTNVYPDANLLAMGLTKIVKSLDWSNFVLIYENDESLAKIQDILKLQEHKNGVEKNNVIVKRLSPDEGPNTDYRPLLKEVATLTPRRIILDCDVDKIPHIMKQAEGLKLIDDISTSFFLTSLDAHTLDFSGLKIAANLTTIRLFDPKSPNVQNAVSKYYPTIPPEKLKVETALQYDAMLVFAKSINALLEKNPKADLSAVPKFCNNSKQYNDTIGLIQQIRERGELEDSDAIAKTNDEVFNENDRDMDYTPECLAVSFEEGENVTSEAIDFMNKGFSLIGTSPIKKNKINQKRYSVEKIQNLSEAISKKIFHTSVNVNNDSIEENDGNSLLQTLKDEFISTTDRAKQMKILTICKEWTFRKVQHHFPSATRHMITVAKKTAEEKGILADPNPKSHPSLEKEVIDTITRFYELDENSRIMPGKKDYVSVKVNDERVHMQKRLLLINLKELYQMFKENHPQMKCSFSKFAMLRPKNCVLAGASGTHSVCVCAIHENVKLSIEGSNLKNLTANSPNPIKSYHDCLKQMICIEPSMNCYFGKCTKCPGATKLINELEKIFEENFIDEITYRQWTNVDRSTLQLMISPVDEFLEKLKIGLEKLLLHSYLVKKQNEFMNNKKKELTENECIAVCDFSENYAFVVQDSVQGVHWNNNQATVHPFAIYYRDDDGEIGMKSFVIISECLHHDTIAVYVFQEHLVHFIKKNFRKISKILYFSDGASGQYKNRKNFINLTHHQEDFGLAAEWHFFPTSHGKGACDGLGGTLKRLAARASLQRVKNPIQTPKELLEWATESLPNVSLKFVENEEYNKAEKKLEARFQMAVTVKGTLGYHCILPITKKNVKAKHFSLQDHSTTVAVMK